MWFDALVGFEEESGEQVRENLSVDGEMMVSTVNGRRMRCGTLELASLAELRHHVALAGHSDRLRLRQLVADVGALHRDPANTGAFFQAASQFNLLEMVSPDVTPEDGVTRYQSDRTQGPACAIACGAGTILRNYFVEVNGRTGQTADNQIDCLADIADHLFPGTRPAWTMTNGYAMFDEPGLDRLNARLEAMSSGELDAVRSRLRIGVHHNVEVTQPSVSDAGVLVTQPDHCVTQAYCSALPVAYSSAPRHTFERFARLVLEASYEATLLAAALNARQTGNSTVYLTLLGGGVFGNDMSWIADAIDRACVTLHHLDLDLVIVSHRAPSPEVTALVERVTNHQD